MYYAFRATGKRRRRARAAQPRKGTWLAWLAPKVWILLEEKAGFFLLGPGVPVSTFSTYFGTPHFLFLFSGAFPMLKCTLFEPSSTLLNSLLSSQVLSVRLLVSSTWGADATTSLWRLLLYHVGRGSSVFRARESCESFGTGFGFGDVDRFPSRVLWGAFSSCGGGIWIKGVRVWFGASPGSGDQVLS